MKRVQRSEAISLLQSGQNVAFPTETVYGLGGNALDSKAVQGIFTAKGRPSDNPLIVHVDSIESAKKYVKQISPLEELLMRRYWPGPLTLILPIENGMFASEVTAGLNTVGMRVPAHPQTLELLKECALPLAAPSANRSGKPSPTMAEHVLHDLGDSIAGVLDGGACSIGLESTVIRCIEQTIYILRPGSITPEQLEETVSSLNVQVLTSGEDHAEVEQPRSPGMKYPHYAPSAEMMIFYVSASLRASKSLENALLEDIRQGHQVAMIAFEQTIERFGQLDKLICMNVGSVDELSTALRLLYQLLRECDEKGITRIWIEGSDEAGQGLAYMNRILKAAKGNLLRFDEC